MSTPTSTSADAMPPAAGGKVSPLRAVALMVIGVAILVLIVLFTTDHRRQRTAISSVQRLCDRLSGHPASADEPPRLGPEDIAAANQSRGYTVLRVEGDGDADASQPLPEVILACTVEVRRTLLTPGRAVVLWRPGRLSAEWMSEPAFREALHRTSRTVVPQPPDE